MLSIRRLMLYSAIAALIIMIVGPAALGSQKLVGLVAPVLTFKDVSGKEIKISDGKPAMIYFWMTSCQTCSAMVPLLNKLQAEYSKAGFTVIGIGAGETVKSTEKYLSDKAVSYPLVPDRDGSISDAFGISVTPSIYLVGKDGVVLVFKTGYRLQLDDAYYLGVIKGLMSGN